MIADRRRLISGWRSAASLSTFLALLVGCQPVDDPSLFAAASKDALSANLDSIQIIKGWVDSEGATHEKIYDVALSPNRERKGSPLAPGAVGNTVDIAGASYTNAIGSAQLSARWADPDYEQNQSAFYYARVLEIPTPR